NDFTSPYLNIRGWERLSYEPEGDRSAMPVVAMLGGSTTWGEGQRDEYTIASWLARFAERDGVPLVIHNYGQRGWTHFQEMILYEQLLALGPVPDISVFYDGANELTTQSLLDVAVPSHTMAYAYAERLTGKTVATEFLQQPATRAPWSAAWEAYQEHSAIDKLAGLLRGEPAGAAPRQDDGAPGDGFTSGQEENEDGLISNYDITDQDGIDAGKVYERGKALTLEISRTYGVEPLLFWQPMAQDVRPQQLARAELTDSTIDISGVLQDHREVFIDAVHTNEEGARMVAEAIWKHLGPAIHRWYREHD
ncbi:MAG: SGNH/GDSL hydrolase family protein, partial [Acidimicrobiales bacterium]|nr:SGNH/GDSL hydrolase family protein [Acidimicrobiales bacterium]